MFSVAMDSHCIKEKMYKFKIPRKKSALGIFLSFKFKGRAIWPSPGSHFVDLNKKIHLNSKTDFVYFMQLSEKIKKVLMDWTRNKLIYCWYIMSALNFCFSRVLSKDMQVSGSLDLEMVGQNLQLCFKMSSQI